MCRVRDITLYFLLLSYGKDFVKINLIVYDGDCFGWFTKIFREPKLKTTIYKNCEKLRGCLFLDWLIPNVALDRLFFG